MGKNNKTKCIIFQGTTNTNSIINNIKKQSQNLIFKGAKGIGNAEVNFNVYNLKRLQ